jgi:lipopolysaccharide export LptBFGC system permease protein LptF
MPTRPAGERSYSINVGSAGAGSVLRQVRIFEFDADGRLLSRTSAAEAKVHRDGRWTLSDVVVTRWKDAGVDSTARQEQSRHARLEEQPLAQGGGRRGAAGDDDVDGRALALHRPPRTRTSRRRSCRRSSSGSAPSTPSPAS